MFMELSSEEKGRLGGSKGKAVAAGASSPWGLSAPFHPGPMPGGGLGSCFIQLETETSSICTVQAYICMYVKKKEKREKKLQSYIYKGRARIYIYIFLLRFHTSGSTFFKLAFLHASPPDSLCCFFKN